MRQLFTSFSFVIRSFSVAILLLHCASASNAASTNNQETSICFPCTRNFLSDPYLTSEEDLTSINCDNLPTISNLDGNFELQRNLEGEGSHRRLISKLKFGNQLPSFDGFNCELVIIESLHEVFADPFELQRLVKRKVYLDAAVFGDTNLELPSALSNQSIVEIHMDMVHAFNAHHELTIELPLHARYPPLDSSGYKTVEIPPPQLYTRCRQNKKEKESSSCHWRSPVLNVGPTETVMWRAPCGDEAHGGFVKSFTFVTALVCALCIVFASVVYDPSKICGKDR
ncbi:hypothetical protein LUZ60_001397 [Juncus effusus]|nr:hypothetical protein LUZ60_001397 [Juncus effusus]